MHRTALIHITLSYIHTLIHNIICPLHQYHKRIIISIFIYLSINIYPFYNIIPMHRTIQIYIHIIISSNNIILSSYHTIYFHVVIKHSYHLSFYHISIIIAVHEITASICFFLFYSYIYLSSHAYTFHVCVTYICFPYIHITYIPCTFLLIIPFMQSSHQHTNYITILFHIHVFI